MNVKAQKGQTSTAEQVNQLRIIGGKWRSRRLEFPSADGLRPTGDRIRETLFNWLAPHLPGARCLDAFAGSGALGFEALSRGAKEVVFVEKNPSALQYLTINRDKLEAQTANIIPADVVEWLTREHETTFDIIFLDPPFSDSLHDQCLQVIAESTLFHANTLIYIESNQSYSPNLPLNWDIYKDKKTASLAYRLLRTAE